MPVPLPSQDPFYEDTGTPVRPGAVVRVREVRVPLDNDPVGWQVVHGSTGALGQPIAISGTLLVPAAPWRGHGPRPILSYGVGVHGLGRDAAPSHLIRRGDEAELPLVSQALDRGWAVAVSDGDGLGMPGPHTYGAGRPGGHAMLDIVRAAVRCVPELVADAPVLLWGYSEGGRCAAWAAELQPGYAPELALVAVAAGGVPSDLYAVAKAIDGGPFSGLGLAVLVGLAHAHQHPAMWAILNERGKAAAAHAAGLDVVGLIVDHPEPMRAHTTKDDPWDDPVWRDLLRRERNGGLRPNAPVYLYHVDADPLVPTALGHELYEDYRRLGADVTWADVRAPEHLSGAFVGAPEALSWLEDRLAEPRRLPRPRDRTDADRTEASGPSPVR